MYQFLLFAFLFLAGQASAQKIETIPVVVESGEQLGTIAERYFKRPAYVNWREIAKLNNLKTTPYTIYPGMVLNLPAHLFATQSAPAKWLSVTGSVRIVAPGASQSAAAVAGSFIEEGSRVVVANDASALMELPDGSQVKLTSGSQFILDESRYYRGYQRGDTTQTQTGTKGFSGLMRLIQGAVETRATTSTDRAKPLRIQTPTTVVGVRGTDFRVSHFRSSSQDASDPVTRSEVVEGLVSAELDARRKTQVSGGFGVLLDPKLPDIPKPVALLEAPTLQNWPVNQNTVALEFPALPNVQSGRLVSAYRVQMALDEARSQVVFNQRFASGQSIRIPTQQDGAYYLSVRAADDQGLEGADAKLAVSVDARPTAPLLQAPNNGDKFVQGADVMLLWSRPQGAISFVVEIQDQQQKRTQYRVDNAQYGMTNLPTGSYGWRVAAQTQTSPNVLKTGAWSEQQIFAVLGQLAAPETKLDDDFKTLSLRWPSQKSREYEVQTSRTPIFDQAENLSKVVTYTVKKPELNIADPSAGKHFIRYRIVEESGLTSGWSQASEVDVPKDARSLWLLIWAAITAVL